MPTGMPEIGARHPFLSYRREASAPPVKPSRRSHPMNEPPAHLPLLELAFSTLLLRALHTVAERGVADVLADADGPLTSAEIAERVGVRPAGLHQVMRGLAGIGVFTSDREGRFRLTPMGETLRSDHPSA